jgi:hypothetical protein
MKTAIVVTVMIIAALLFVAMYQNIGEKRAEANSQVAPLSSEDFRAMAPGAALQGCETWTRERGPVGMGNIVREYEQVGKPIAGDHYRVAFDYRSKGSGALMRSTCEYSVAGGEMVLVHASSGARP